VPSLGDGGGFQILPPAVPIYDRLLAFVWPELVNHV